MSSPSTSTSFFAGLDVNAFVKVFQTLTETIGKVITTFLQLEAYDAKINNNASSFAASDRTRQEAAVKSMDEKLRLESAKADDKLAAEAAIHNIKMDTGNVGLTGNQLAISTIVSSPDLYTKGVDDSGSTVYKDKQGNTVFSQADLDLAQSKVSFADSGPAPKTKEEAEARTKAVMAQHEEVRAAQQRILTASSENLRANNSEHPLVAKNKDGKSILNTESNPTTGEKSAQVNYDQLASYLDSPTGPIKTRAINGQQAINMNLQLKRFEAATKKLETDYKEFYALPGVEQPKTRAAAPMSQAERMALTGQGGQVDFYDTESRRQSMAAVLGSRGFSMNA